MKLYKNLTLMACGALLTLSSCMDEYESLPVNQYTYDYLFSQTDSAGNKALGLLNDIYNDLSGGHNRVGSDYLDAASDDAISIKMSSNPDVYKLQMGQYTSRTRISSDMFWGSCYQSIRKVNLLLSGVDRVPFKETYTDATGTVRPLNVTVKAEARFLRAWYYFLLLERYGGIPLVGDKVFDVNDNLELPRNTFAECVDYIVSELDAIQDSLRTLPMANAQLYAHAATKPACMALKSRVLLYAASPLFNGLTLQEGNELVGYAAYDATRWQKAADAAKALIDTFGPNGTGALKLAPKFREAFLSYYTRNTNQELIFFRQGGKGTSIETTNGPLGFTNSNLASGRTNPTQNLVDAFPMKDGKAVGESTKYAYNSQTPYANRDPRLDMTVLHNGSKWLGKQLQTWQGGANNPTVTADYSRTSYFMDKFMGDFTSVTEYSSQLHLWIYFRYAEILLNYAEAENEALDSPSKDVYDAIIALRARAGIEAGTDGLYGLAAGMTKEQMRLTIYNERRIELAFEEHRYFDIRRWREAETLFASPLRGMRITKDGVYSVVDVLTVTFDPKRYLYPIPYDEVNKNDNMVQNPNWN